MTEMNIVSGELKSNQMLVFTDRGKPVEIVKPVCLAANSGDSNILQETLEG